MQHSIVPCFHSMSCNIHMLTSGAGIVRGARLQPMLVQPAVGSTDRCSTGLQQLRVDGSMLGEPPQAKLFAAPGLRHTIPCAAGLPRLPADAGGAAAAAKGGGELIREARAHCSASSTGCGLLLTPAAPNGLCAAATPRAGLLGALLHGGSA